MAVRTGGGPAPRPRSPRRLQRGQAPPLTPGSGRGGPLCLRLDAGPHVCFASASSTVVPLESGRGSQKAPVSLLQALPRLTAFGREQTAGLGPPSPMGSPGPAPADGARLPAVFGAHVWSRGPSGRGSETSPVWLPLGDGFSLPCSRLALCAHTDGPSTQGPREHRVTSHPPDHGAPGTFSQRKEKEDLSTRCLLLSFSRKTLGLRFLHELA